MCLFLNILEEEKCKKIAFLFLHFLHFTYSTILQIIMQY